MWNGNDKARWLWIGLFMGMLAAGMAACGDDDDAGAGPVGGSAGSSVLTMKGAAR